ncbi:MAG: hypothetical protein JWO49_2750 [Arthrobacter sp.]|nr:hypothetical protein [Arthrobacter sp.]
MSKRAWTRTGVTCPGPITLEFRKFVTTEAAAHSLAIEAKFF